MSQNTDTIARQPNGQFDFSASHPEPTGTLTRLYRREMPDDDTTPIAMTDMGIAVGDSRYLSDFETGDAMFDQLEIRHTESGYEVSGMIPVDLYGELTDGTDHTAAETYLNDREPDVNNFLRDHYGAELEEGNTEWDEQAVMFTVSLADDDTTADLITKLRDNSQVVELHNDLAGAYDPSRTGGFYRNLLKTLEQQDTDREEATRSYVTAAMWTATDDGEPIEERYEESDIDPASLAQEREQLVDFMRANRGLLARAAELRPGFYDASQAGHDFHLTRNGHGAGFWDRGLGDVGDQLTDSAKSYGSAELYVGDDGRLYFGG